MSERHTEGGERDRSRPAAAEQREQQVLRADPCVTERVGLVLGARERGARARRRERAEGLHRIVRQQRDRAAADETADAPSRSSTIMATPSPSRSIPSRMWPVSISERRNDSRRASWRTRFARAVNGRSPVGDAVSPRPTIRSIWTRTSPSRMCRSASTRPAAPCSSRTRASSRCSVPTYAWSRIRASSAARSIASRAACEKRCRPLFGSSSSEIRHARTVRLHRREIDRRARDHVGRDLEHAEQQVLGRDDVLALALDVLQGGLEDRDVLPNGQRASARGPRAGRPGAPARSGRRRHRACAT